MEQVVITGMGIISSIGLTVTEYWSSLVDGRTAIEPTTMINANGSFGYGSQVGSDFNPARCLDPVVLRTADRLTQFSLCAASQAVAASGMESLPSLRTAVILGSTMGSVPTLVQSQSGYDQGGASVVPARLMSQVIPNMPAAHLAMRWGLHGPLLTISTACASSLDAIGQAARMVERGDVDFAIAGGVDSLLTPLVYHSFVNARVVSRATDPLLASRPFDRNRDGFVMGEGAGIVILEQEETARRRRQPILARIRGYGSVADAHHVTSPEPSGRWEALAMKLALKEVGRRDEKPHIDALIAHGTGTKVGDAAEIRAINDVFGRHSPSLAVTSIKGHIGHSMAASGVMALIAGVQALIKGQLPPTMGTTTVDPEAQFTVVLKHPKSMDIRQVQINAFGFGGQNAAMVISR